MLEQVALPTVSDARLQIVGKMLGHRNYTTTQRHAHIADTVLRDAVNRTSKKFVRAEDTPGGELGQPQLDRRQLGVRRVLGGQGPLEQRVRGPQQLHCAEPLTSLGMLAPLGEHDEAQRMSLWASP